MSKYIFENPQHSLSQNTDSFLKKLKNYSTLNVGFFLRLQLGKALMRPSQNDSVRF